MCTNYYLMIVMRFMWGKLVEIYPESKRTVNILLDMYRRIRLYLIMHINLTIPSTKIDLLLL